MLCIDANHAFEGFGVLLTRGFSDADSFGRVLYESTPMMLSGVAIAFAFKLGSSISASPAKSPSERSPAWCLD
jgi:ABC-type uncharacterized transport system permease subunit